MVEYGKDAKLVINADETAVRLSGTFLQMTAQIQPAYLRRSLNAKRTHKGSWLRLIYGRGP
eukprot:5472852-Amphidinium_carterae.1